MMHLTYQKDYYQDIVFNENAIENSKKVLKWIKENINNYVYELYSPISASEFINNPLLNIALFNAVGKLEYERVVGYFKIPKINLEYPIFNDFSEILNDFFPPIQPICLLSP